MFTKYSSLTSRTLTTLSQHTQHNPKTQILMDLLAAAAQGDTHTITSILNSKSINVNFQNKVNGWTALHWACKRNQVPTVKLLLAHGAKCLLNFKGETPLDVAQDPSSLEFMVKGSLESGMGSSLLAQDVINELSETSLQRILSKFDLASKQDLLIKLRG